MKPRTPVVTVPIQRHDVSSSKQPAPARKKNNMNCGKRVSSIGMVTLSVLVPLTLACFITNCPPGGKRSNLPPIDKETRLVIRQCARCGPNLLGRCFGPRVCCSDKLGCLVASAESAVGNPSTLALLPCVAESLFPKPCSNGPASKCGRGAKGVCAASGVCCFHNSCQADANCVKVRRVNAFSRESNAIAREDSVQGDFEAYENQEESVIMDV